MRTLAFLLVGFVPTIANAAPPKSPKAADLPPAAATLAATQDSPSQWTLRVENAGSVPLTLMADVRLVSLELEVPGAKKANVCTLPESVRAEVSLDRQIVLPPGASFTERFDPRFYCFAGGDAEAFARATRVTVHYGYTPKKSGTQVAPFAVGALPTSPATISGLKELAAAPMEIPQLEAPRPADIAPGDPNEPGPYTVSLPHRTDVERGFDVSAALTITNHGPLRSWVYFRPPVVGFSVVKPDGSKAECAPSQLSAESVREAYTAVNSGGSATLSVDLTALCRPGTFRNAGYYTVSPRIDASRASGAALGLRSFVGGAVGSEMPLRVRHSSGDAKTSLPKPDVAAPETPPSNR